MHPLLRRLLDDCGYPEVDLDNHGDFAGRPGINVLFFPGDPKRFRDTTDVAVVLPELVKAFEGALHPGVVTAAAGKPLQQHYGFELWPALVFLRDGEHLGSICRIHNWSDYLQKIGDLISGPARPLPGGDRLPLVNI